MVGFIVVNDISGVVGMYCWFVGVIQHSAGGRDGQKCIVNFTMECMNNKLRFTIPPPPPPARLLFINRYLSAIWGCNYICSVYYLIGLSIEGVCCTYLGSFTYCKSIQLVLYRLKHVGSLQYQ